MTREEWRDRAVEHGVEIAKLKKQLAIAVEALKEYADRGNWQNDFGYPCLYSEDKGYEGAEKALKQIEELENERK